jgi:acyl carrier protein
MIDRIYHIFSDILEVDEEELEDNFGPKDSALWDSMNNLRLVTAIEEEFKIKLSMDDINQMTDFGKIKKILRHYI